MAHAVSPNCDAGRLLSPSSQHLSRYYVCALHGFAWSSATLPERPRLADLTPDVRLLSGSTGAAAGPDLRVSEPVLWPTQLSGGSLQLLQNVHHPQTCLQRLAMTLQGISSGSKRARLGSRTLDELMGLFGAIAWPRGGGTLMTRGVSQGNVPVISEHDTWITVDSVIGCPANCSYCYLGPIGLRAVRPVSRIPPRQAAEALYRYLTRTRGDTADPTPVCLGNYTDMLLTSANQDYLLEFARGMTEIGIKRPLVVISKGRMSHSLAEALNRLNITVIVFHSQSFHRATLEVRTEVGPVLTPQQTFDAAKIYRDLENIIPIHFWRPITRKSVPSAAWATETVLQLKAAEYRCSVAIGLAVGPGTAQQDLIETRLLDQTSDVRGEIWDREVWAEILAASRAVDYPIYRSTSCAIALATGKPEALGVWDTRRGSKDRCLPCNCPGGQRARCQASTFEPEGVDQAIAWIATHLKMNADRFEVLPGHRVRVRGEVPQSMISMILHKYQIELLPESISVERAWLGRFGRGDNE